MSAPAGRGVGASDSLGEARHRAGIGSGDDREVTVGARTGGSADLCHVILAQNNLLALKVAAFLREFLVFDMNPGDAAALELANGAIDVEFVAVAGIGIGDDGEFDRCSDAPGIGDHLGHRDEAEIGVAQYRRSAGAGHVDGGNPCLFDELGGDAVIGSGRHHHSISVQQLSKVPRLPRLFLP